MTVSATTNEVRYTGNGVTTDFAFNGRIFSSSDLQVDIITTATDALVETLTLSTHYSVTIVDDNHATVSITAPAKIPSTLQDIQIKSVLSPTQSNDIPRGGALPAESIENSLDKLTVLLQQRESDLSRCIKLQSTETPSDVNTLLPLPTTRANKYLGFDGNGDINYLPGSSSTADMATVTGVQTLTNKTISTGCTYNAGAVTSNGAVTGAQIVATGNTVPTNGLYLPAANTLGWACNSTEYMRLGATGLFIGTTSGTSQLGVTALTAQNVANWRNYDNIGRGFAFINSSGLQVGSITWNATTTTYNTTSDYRLKTNVKNIEEALIDVGLIKPRSFEFISQPGKKHVGFIAHELQAICPYAVQGEKDAVDAEGNPVYQVVDHSKLVPLLTAALQELRRKVFLLEQRIADIGG